MSEVVEQRAGQMWTRGRILATAVVGFLVATMGYSLLRGLGESRLESNLVLPGTPVSDASLHAIPEDYDIPALDGGTIRLSEFSGNVLVLDFWATWCLPCREEVPQLVRLAERNRDRGLRIVGLHIDDDGRSTMDDIVKFVQLFEVNYTVGLASNEVFISYLGTTRTEIPQTLVFDRRGRLVEHLIGYSPFDAKKLEEAVNRALAAR